jgi:VanZ family protein
MRGKSMHIHWPVGLRPNSSVTSVVRMAAWIGAGLVGVLSLLPHDEIEPIRTGYYGFGLRAEHLVAYAAVTAAFGSAYGERWALWRLGLALTTYGGLLELGQTFVPGRTPQVADALENLIGVIVGSMLLTLARRTIRWRIRRPSSA